MAGFHSVLSLSLFVGSSKGPADSVYMHTFGCQMLKHANIHAQSFVLFVSYP